MRGSRLVRLEFIPSGNGRCSQPASAPPADHQLAVQLLVVLLLLVLPFRDGFVLGTSAWRGWRWPTGAIQGRREVNSTGL